MAFDNDNFGAIGGEALIAPAVWSYRTNDTIDAVSSAEYFISKQFQLEAGDIIICYCSDGSVTGIVKSDSKSIIPQTLKSQIRVNQENVATTLGGTIDSTKEYFIDGVIDCTGVSIEVPSTGLELKGYSFDLSGLTCADNSYSMFTSPLSGSGNVLIADLYISVTGTSSKVFDISDSDNTHAIEFGRVNFIDCTSLGVIDGYRQGLELGTGRFGGSPSLTLEGSWAGGYRVTTTIARSLSASMTEPVFKKGAAFIMQSRFFTDINVDLPASAALLDFNSANFPNSSTLQIRGAIVTRDGVNDPTDSNITPNISPDNLSCLWRDNNGISNTFVGAQLEVTSQSATTISSPGVPTDIAGTFTLSGQQHFSSPSSTQLKNDGENPREFLVNYDFIINGTANDEIELSFVVDRTANGGGTDIVFEKIRPINSLVGGRDVGFWTGIFSAIINKGDIIRPRVSNETAARNVTIEDTSYYLVSER